MYAHIVSPHAPFVFNSYGGFALTGSIVPGYTDEVAFSNEKMIEGVKQIPATSSVPPVTVIQADHSWDDDHRMEILNACYLPDGGSEMIYPEITPVNTFRVIFNKDFGQNLPLVKDECTFSHEDTPFTFTKVPSTCVGPDGNQAARIF